MSDRRDFLKNVIRVASFTMVPIGTTSIELPEQIEVSSTTVPSELVPGQLLNLMDCPSKLAYKGFQLFWTGWKPDFCCDSLVGQWCAYEGKDKYDPNGRRFYASYPGKAKQYFIGELFDVNVYGDQGQVFVTLGADKEDKKIYMLNALQRLMALIDSAVAVAE